MVEYEAVLASQRAGACQSISRANFRESLIKGASGTPPVISASSFRAPVDNMRHTLLTPGRLVRPLADRIGTGKIVKAGDDECVVEFFHSVSNTELRSYRTDELTPVHLARQTRCYVRDPESGRWLAGRIGSRDGLVYEVFFPDKRCNWIVDSDIYVRSNAPCEDPTETLMLKCHETALFHGPRLELVKALVRQRAISRGLTGLASAKIELFAHQVEVVRRVLEDPIQRYLLADEVGLGKTIEAGVLVRQFLIDEPDGDVLILVPGLLLEQWRHELGSRFGAFDSGRVHLVSTSETDLIPARTSFGMLVVDEAHHVAAGASPGSPTGAVFEMCCQLARVTERVILLSATPAASNEAQFLAMLHILDPETYRLDEVEAFRERVRMRQEIGRLLLTVTEEARPFSLKLNLPKIAAIFPNDHRLAELGRDVLDSLEHPASDVAARAQKIRAIRTHVSETYRLHRRMLRNRRGSIPDAILDRADQRLTAIRDESEEARRLNEALDEWRTLVATAVRRREEVGEGGALRAQFQEVFLAFAETSNGSPRLLEQAIRWRLHANVDARGDLTSELTPECIRRVRETSFVDGEAEALQLLLVASEAASTANHRVRALEKLLLDIRGRAGRATPPRCVVFTAYSSTAREIAARLEVVLGRSRVARHIEGMPREVIEESVNRFRESYDCFVLVCDHTAEEGRNLQFADRLIHFDLPLHPNRLEQRIGRVDRISRVRDLTSHVLLGSNSPDSLSEAWFQLLNDGLGIFQTSIASLQFYVDARLPRIQDHAFRWGATGLVQEVPMVRAEIEAERERIEEQAAIDEIDARDESATEFFRALDEADAGYPALQNAVEGWMCGALQFSRQADDRAGGAVHYSALDRTLVPADVLATRFRRFLRGAGTYDRTTAARHRELALYRLGDGLIESLADYVAWDDRGRAFAIWREDPEWDAREGAEWVGFRFNLIVEADTDASRNVLDRLAGDRATVKSLRRRADALLPPRTETIFVDVALNEVVDSELLDRLRRPFSKHRGPLGLDHNLTKHRLEAIDQVVADGVWDRLCREARDAALHLIRERRSFRDRCERYAAGAERKLGLQLEQLRLRALRGARVDLRELQIEEALCDTLVAGIKAPRLRVDAAGFIVVSGRGPLPQPAVDSEEVTGE